MASQTGGTATESEQNKTGGVAAVLSETLAQSSAEHRVDAVKVLKPRADHREYRSAVLPNKLQVVVVSDEKCDRAAAALSVGVGSLHDPRELPGLAHFCEHMLFLGTEKYPQEDEYREHLAKHGGASNATTAESVTNYFFSVAPEALESSLDRFAQFFISPLFSQSATDRELQAVDSEHSKNMQNDTWRQQQMLRNAADPAHPLNHFMTGSSKTLRDDPAAAGVDVRAALLDFHRRYYSANLMKLVIVGRASPEELLELAHAKFSAIADLGARVPQGAEICPGVEAFPPARLARQVHFLPVADVRGAAFQFVLPSQKPNWRSKPLAYLAHLLGHAGKGSLTAALKRRGLATSLSAASALDEAGVNVFEVAVVLTEAGEADVAAVGDLLFAYVRLLRETGPSMALWEELRGLKNMEFEFSAISDSMSTAASMAAVLQEHEAAVALSAGTCILDFGPEQIGELVELLCCDRMRLVLTGKSHAEKCDASDPWYGTRHAEGPLEAALRARWEAAGGFDDLALPAPNPFVPQDLEIRPRGDGPHPEFPEEMSLADVLASQVQGTSVIRAFFRKDEQFELPKASTTFIIYSPFGNQSLANTTLAALWCGAMREELNEFAYDASCAGLQYIVLADSCNAVCSFSGYSHKLPKLVEAVATRMASLAEFSEQSYCQARTTIEQAFLNMSRISPPYSQCVIAEQGVIATSAYTPLEMLESLRAAGGREVLEGLNRRFLDSCHVECLLQGNLTREEAACLVRSFVEPLGVREPLPRLSEKGVARLPSGWTVLQRLGTNAEEKNGAVTVLLQVSEYTLRSQGMVALTMQVLAQRFFDDLRTKQQLGYIVQASACGDPSEFIGIRFIVQSEVPPFEVFRRIQTWTEEAWEFLETGLTESAFQEYKTALLSTLRERPKNLQMEIMSNAIELAARTFLFGRDAKVADLLESVGLAELRSFVAASLRTAPALAVLVRPQGTEAEPAEALAPWGARAWSEDDVAEFRRSAEYRFRDPACFPEATVAEPPEQLRCACGGVSLG